MWRVAGRRRLGCRTFVIFKVCGFKFFNQQKSTGRRPENPHRMFQSNFVTRYRTGKILAHDHVNSPRLAGSVSIPIGLNDNPPV